MAQQTSPFSEVKYGWDLGESGWNLGMDEDLLKFSFHMDGNIDAVVNTLPVLANGKAYFLTTDRRIYYVVNNTAYSTPTPKWYVVKVRDTGAWMQFDGTSLVTINNPSQLQGSINNINSSISTINNSLNTKANIASPTFTGTVSGITKAMVGLANVDNTSDAAKPVSSLQQTAIYRAFGVNVKFFGATGDGVTNDNAAIQAAYNSLPNGSGILYFPKGRYICTGLNFDGAIGLTLVGEGQLNASVIVMSGASATGTTIRSSFNVTISGIEFTHDSASFQGYLLDLSHRPAGSGTVYDTQRCSIRECAFRSVGLNLYSAKGLNLNQATCIDVVSTTFVSLLRAVDGQAAGGGSFSNVITFDRCQFADNVSFQFNYLGEQWMISNCNFQPCRDQTQRIAYSESPQVFHGLMFVNCSVYDAAAAFTNAMFQLGAGNGFTIIGGMYGGRGDLGSCTLLRATGAINGAWIKGAYLQRFTNLLVADVTGNGDWDASSGNTFNQVNLPLITNPQNITTPTRGSYSTTSGGNSVRYLPDGSMEITGTVSVTSGTTSNVTFSTPFPVACWDVQLTMQTPAAATNVTYLTAVPTATGFSVNASGSGTNIVRFRAIGR